MPDVVGGWLCSLLGTLGGIRGGKLYILGVVGYITPIWDVLAPQREREEAGEHLWGDRLLGSLPIRDSFPIRQAVPDGLAQASFCSWARWARFFMEKNVYCSKYSIFVSILPFFSSQGREEWMDGVGRVRMTPSQLGKRSHFGLGFGTGLAGLRFP